MTELKNKDWLNVKELAVILVGSVLSMTAAASPVGADCTYKGIPLKGRVQVVTAFGDIKVKVVDHFPDLKVQSVKSFPTNCGQWQFVKSFPDIKVEFVKVNPDFTIKLVDVFPGRP